MQTDNGGDGEVYIGLFPFNDERLSKELQGRTLPDGAIGVLFGDVPKLGIMEIGQTEDEIMFYRCAPTGRLWEPGDAMLTLYAVADPDGEGGLLTQVLEDARHSRWGRRAARWTSG